jgi:hypothetical protein
VGETSFHAPMAEQSCWLFFEVLGENSNFYVYAEFSTFSFSMVFFLSFFLGTNQSNASGKC